MPPKQGEIRKRAAILQSEGYDIQSDAVRQTAIKYYSKPLSLTNRVDSFINEDLRRESYMAIKNKFKTESKYGTSSQTREKQRLQAIEDYEKDRMKRLYFPPTPVIPYPHADKKVTALGFNRIEENLPTKIAKEYEKRFMFIKKQARKMKLMEKNALRKLELGSPNQSPD